MRTASPSPRRRLAARANCGAGLRPGGRSTAIFVSGNSAGGHLVAELMDRAWPPAHGLPDEVIAGGCAISGLFELEPVRRSAQNATLGFTAEEAAALSPARRVGRGAPLLVSVGGAEAEEFLRQSRDFAAAWNAAGNRAELVIPAGADHITVVLDAFAVPGSGLNAAMMRLIREAHPG